MRGIVRRRTVDGEAVEIIALQIGVLDRERIRMDLVAEPQALLADRLSVSGIADDRHRNERTQRVDDELARRRASAGCDHDESLQAERIIGIDVVERTVTSPIRSQSSALSSRASAALAASRLAGSPRNPRR